MYRFIYIYKGLPLYLFEYRRLGIGAQFAEVEWGQRRTLATGILVVFHPCHIASTTKIHETILGKLPFGVLVVIILGIILLVVIILGIILRLVIILGILRFLGIIIIIGVIILKVLNFMKISKKRKQRKQPQRNKQNFLNSNSNSNNIFIYSVIKSIAINSNSNNKYTNFMFPPLTTD